MTTSITIAAHLASNKEVKATVTDNGQFASECTLQDGETTEILVYDGREVTVKEVEK